MACVFAKRSLWCALVCFGGVPACRVPPRRAGNFHLRPQMKVTKAKGLHATPLSSFFALRPSAQRATWRHRCASGRHRARRHGPRNASPALNHWSFAPPRRGPTFPLDPGPTRSEAPSSELRRRSAAELPSGPPGAVPARAERKYRFCIQGLCFGDFHLAAQMKVTRPPGRDPAAWHTTKTQNHPNNPCRYHCAVPPRRSRKTQRSRWSRPSATW